MDYRFKTLDIDLLLPEKDDSVDEEAMHLKELERLVDNFTDDEAEVCCRSLVKRFPDILMTALHDEYERLKHIENEVGSIAGGTK